MNCLAKVFFSCFSSFSLQNPNFGPIIAAIEFFFFQLNLKVKAKEVFFSIFLFFFSKFTFVFYVQQTFNNLYLIN